VDGISADRLASFGPLSALYTFDVANPWAGKVGTGMTVVATDATTSGSSGDGQVSLAQTGYLSVPHGLNTGGLGAHKKSWTILVDFRFDSLPSSWSAILQFAVTNAADAAVQVRQSSGYLWSSRFGSATTGQIIVGNFHRLVITVQEVEGLDSIGRMYLDGKAVAQSLCSTCKTTLVNADRFLLFADDSGDKSPATITTCAVWPQALSARMCSV
jgi:hypothetical protein